MTLWGIPYPMRPGQSPRDLLGPPSVADNGRGVFQNRREPSELGWIYLGGPGWWGSHDLEAMARAYAWLAERSADIPQGPYEWCTVEAFDPRAEAALILSR